MRTVFWGVWLCLTVADLALSVEAGNPQSSVSDCSAIVEKIAQIASLEGTVVAGSLSELPRLLREAAQKNPSSLQTVQRSLREWHKYADFIERYNGKNESVLTLQRALKMDPSFSKGKLLICAIGRDCNAFGLNFYMGTDEHLSQLRPALFRGGKFPQGFSLDDREELLRLSAAKGGHSQFVFLETGANVESILHELGHYGNSLLLNDWVAANLKLPEDKRDRLFQTYTRVSEDGSREIDLGFVITFEESQAQGNFLELQKVMKVAGLLEVDLVTAEQRDSEAYLGHILESYERNAEWVIESEKITTNNLFQVGRSWAFQMRESVAKAKN